MMRMEAVYQMEIKNRRLLYGSMDTVKEEKRKPVVIVRKLR